MTTEYSEMVKVEGIEYKANFEVEPAQDGGETDPSWHAHVYDLTLSLDSKLIKPHDEDEDGCDFTEIYVEVENQLNAKLARR